MTAVTAPGAARCWAPVGASRRKELRHALVDDAVGYLNRFRTSEERLWLVIANRLQQSILAIRGLKEVANLFQRRYQHSFIQFLSCIHRQNMI